MRSRIAFTALTVSAVASNLFDTDADPTLNRFHCQYLALVKEFLCANELLKADRNGYMNQLAILVRDSSA